jgi:hypothetical protein
MKNLVTCAMVFSCVVLLQGCFTSGKDFVSETTWIKENTTTREEVQRVLGTPFSVGASSGVPTSTYGYYRYELFRGTFTKELKFYWKDNVVQSYSFSSSFPEDTRN